MAGQRSFPSWELDPIYNCDLLLLLYMLAFDTYIHINRIQKLDKINHSSIKINQHIRENYFFKAGLN